MREVHEGESPHRLHRRQQGARWNHRVEQRQRHGRANAAQERPPIEMLLEQKHREIYSAPLGLLAAGNPPPLESFTSCVVMNSSSTGLPSLVARMPFTNACTTCSGSVTRSP